MIRSESVRSPCASFLNPKLRHYFSSTRLSPLRTAKSGSPGNIFAHELEPSSPNLLSQSIRQKTAIAKDPEIAFAFMPRPIRLMRSIKLRRASPETQNLYDSLMTPSQVNSKAGRSSSTKHIRALRFRSKHDTVFLTIPKTRSIPHNERRSPAVSRKTLRLECKAVDQKLITVEVFQSMIANKFGRLR
mmetsp:Transcript_24015/g.42628  ORF Transcript_24015/g.42628 Transcript_24015/m.42628 type:complete len:188 (+) Transcript_24015:3728-4291(+)